jgi:hypothetical protein
MSVDFGMFAKLVVDAISPPKEKPEKYTDNWNAKIDAATVVSIVLSVALGVIAFILSWTCNSALKYHVVIKAFFGTFAFLFGFTYIVLYIFLRWDTCAALMR